jgi:fibronectin-binding autotransporter adhesin
VGATLNGADLIAAQPGVLTAFSGWVPTGTNTWTAGAAMDVTGTNPVAYPATTISALRFNTPGPFTVTLDGSHGIESDMILVTPTAGAGVQILTGGQLSGSAGSSLIVSQNNTAGSLSIGSTLVDNGGASGLTKTGLGLLTLTGANTYTGITRVEQGVLRAADGVGLPTASALILTGGVIEPTTATFNRALGSGAGEVRLVSGAGGFSASGSALAVNLGGAAGTLQWGSTHFNPTALVLNASTADSALQLVNGLDLNGSSREIRVEANTATVTGLISNSVIGSPGRRDQDRSRHAAFAHGQHLQWHHGHHCRDPGHRR